MTKRTHDDCQCGRRIKLIGQNQKKSKFGERVDAMASIEHGAASSRRHLSIFRTARRQSGSTAVPRRRKIYQDRFRGNVSPSPPYRVRIMIIIFFCSLPFGADHLQPTHITRIKYVPQVAPVQQTTEQKGTGQKCRHPQFTP